MADITSLKPCDLLISGGFVVTMAKRGEVFWPGFVAIQGRNIVGVGPSGRVAAEWRATVTLDCTDAAILPGFVNCHVHAGMGLFKAVPAGDLMRAQENVWAFIEALTHETTYAGTRLGCLQMMKAGITTFADMWPLPDANAEAVKSAGMRAVLADYSRNYQARTLEAFVSAASRWDNDRLTPAIGIHSLSDCRVEALREAANAAQAYDLAIHAVAHGSSAPGGESPRLSEARRAGVLRQGAVLTGLARATESDISLVAECGASVACAPVSDAQLGRGMLPLTQWAGILPFGLGTGIAGALGRHDFFDEMRMAALIDRMFNKNSRLEPESVLRMATIDGARVLGMEHAVGSLEIGKRADVITIRMDDVRFAPLHCDRPNQVLANLLFAGGPNDIDTVVVDGRILAQHGRALGLDEHEIAREAQEASSVCLARAGLA